MIESSASNVEPFIAIQVSFCESGLPFGIEFSARPWQDGSLLGIAAAWEQATHLRKAPVLVERGLLSVWTARKGRAMAK